MKDSLLPHTYTTPNTNTMKTNLFTSTALALMVVMLLGCKKNEVTTPAPALVADPTKSDELRVEAEEFTDSSVAASVAEEGDVKYVELPSEGWFALDVEVPVAGRYTTKLHAAALGEGTVIGWVEDYYDNPDGRTYNITGNMVISTGAPGFSTAEKDGSPLNVGLHKMKVHVSAGAKVDGLSFKLIKPHDITPITLTQEMEGTEWEVAWSDEFDGTALDTTKWTYDVGNWGWGNNELQYYTVGRAENTRLEDGNLIIEARKNDMGEPWTSARLTTRGKVSFLYGKIEFRAQVPREKGNWAAGWTLGDTYVDEKSWPYAGEIDIMESVGYEVDDETGDGIAHATVHTPAYYFKIGNQISSTKEVKNIAGEFHTYAVEWTPTEVRGYVDDEHYYTYDKNANEKEWPFHQPQNIILNLAMGGGWGGAQGMDETVTSQKLIIDYIRVYGRK